MQLRRLTFFVGFVFILLAVAGFIPALNNLPHGHDPSLTVTANYGRLFGLFPVNLTHNFVHGILGIWGLRASRADVPARRFNRINAIFYAALAVIGILPGLNTVFGMVPIFGHDIWLHAVIAGATGYLGFVRFRESETSDQSSDQRAIGLT